MAVVSTPHNAKPNVPKRYCMQDPTAALTDRIIMSEIPEGSRVLDLGCGDGRLLCRLRDEIKASVQGVERDVGHLTEAMAKGIPVIRLDLDQGLEDIPDHSFDYVVLSQTLQQVLHPEQLLREMLRVAHRILIVVPNFGHWRVRLQILMHGRVPITSSLPYDWYNTPNLHFMSIIDFRDLVHRLPLRIVKEVPIIRGRASEEVWGANWRADSAMFVLESTSPA